MRKHAVRLLRRHAQDGLADDLQGEMAKLLRNFDGLLGATYFLQLDTLRAPGREAVSATLKCSWWQRSRRTKRSTARSAISTISSRISTRNA